MRIFVLSMMFIAFPGGSPLMMAAAQQGAGHGYLGVGLGDAPRGAPGPAGLVGDLDPNGPAARAGLRRGDLIRAVNGHPVNGGTGLQPYVFNQPPGAMLVLDVLRPSSGGYTRMRITAVLSSGPGAAPPSPAAPPRNPAAPSARPAAPPGQSITVGAPADIRYVHYTDPAETSFSVQLPAGWRVGGKLMRYGLVTISPFVQAMTPDGTIFVQDGDWRIKEYADLPGWREGQLYHPANMVMLIRRYQTAEQYARSYSTAFQRQLGCEQGTVTGSEAMPVAGTASVPQSRLETHLVEFSCRRASQGYVGRVMVTVQAYRVAGYISWDILYLSCLLARQDRASTGLAVWDKMRNTMAFEQGWLAGQRGLSAQSVQAAANSLDISLHQAQLFDQNVINGSITVNDPTTGSRSEIQIGPEPFYFSDGLGHFYNSYDPDPRSGFHAVNPAQ